MAAPSLAPMIDSVSRRRAQRHPLGAPVELVALQSGIPYTMPGRCTDMSEGGLSAVVSGELTAGQAVALELRLPNVALPIRARAQVRYQDRLRYGFQFVGLSLEQREMIRYWAAGMPPLNGQGEEHQERSRPPVLTALDTAPENLAPQRDRWVRRIRVRRRRFLVLVAFVLALTAFGWWQWQRAWKQLENESVSANAIIPLRVSSDIMDQQILYKPDPVYPEAARSAGTEGLVVLDAVIAADGSVKRLRPITGLEVLAQAAVETVQGWRYTPYRHDGQPVEVETTISVEFRLQ